jgi:uncharacterized protein (TIRG00374 family)
VRSRLRTIVQVGVGTGVSVACLLIVAQTVDVSQVTGLLARSATPLFAATIGMTAVDLAIRALRWKTLLRSLVPIPIHRVGGYMLVGYLANTVLPVRLGELIRSHYVGSREGVSRMSVLGTVVAERVLDVTSLLLISALGWWLLGAPDALAKLLLFGFQAVGVAALLASIVVLAWRTRAFSRLLRSRMPDGLRRTTRKFQAGIAVIAMPRTLLHAGTLTLAAWSSTAMAFIAAATALDVPLSLPQAMLIAAAANLATVIPSGPAYVGTFELAVIAVSGPVGITAAPSLAVALLVHAAILVATLVGGGVSLYLIGRTRLTLATATVPPDVESRGLGR